ncbi:MAG: phytoene/squalene synthase family protein [Pseudomonadota bacterium]
MSADADIAACRAAIRQGSKSFYAASRLMPRRYREPALALYAFCRLADDAVDLVEAKAPAVERLHARLDAAYAGRPKDTPADRAFADMVARVEMPRELPEALLEGFDWDAAGRSYDTLSDVRAYSARVAASVGAMMSVVMGVRDADALARACDLGVAMQLTNIARDVGEDAGAGRLYLPLNWMRDSGLDPEAFLAAPRASAPLAQVVYRLLAEAQRLYWRAEAGIAVLPRGCRPAIYAARFIYAAIGQRIRAQDYDSVRVRAHTGGLRKLGLGGRALAASGLSVLLPRSAVLYAPPLEECGYLVQAAARAPEGRWRAAVDRRVNTVTEVFLQLEARDRAAGRQAPGV